MVSVSVAEGDERTLDRILLTDGSQFFGTVLSASEGQIEITTEFAGTMKINVDQIESLDSRQSLLLQLNDGRLLKAQPISIAHKQFVVTTADGDHTTYSVSDIKSINPEPWMLGLHDSASGANLFVIKRFIDRVYRRAGHAGRGQHLDPLRNRPSRDRLGKRRGQLIAMLMARVEADITLVLE